eukprot:g2240.t1
MTSSDPFLKRPRGAEESDPDHLSTPQNDPLAKVPRLQTNGDDADGDLPDEIGEDEILRMLAEADNVQVEALTAQSLKKLVLQLERKLKTNQELRIKFADDPEKFADSEVELNDQLLKFRDLATAPDLYATFSNPKELNGVNLLLRAMAHANTDIVLCVLDVLAALTEPDNFDDALMGGNEEVGGSSSSSSTNVNGAGAGGAAAGSVGERFADTLMGANLAEMLIDALSRIDETASEEDAKGVQDVFSLVENLVEIKPACQRKFIAFLLKRVRRDEGQGGGNSSNSGVDSNKAAAAEILSIFLSNDAEFRAAFDQGSIEKLLRSVAVYRKKDCVDSVEIEFAENVFDCLCHLMLDEAGRKGFGKAQGVELMIRIMLQGNYVSKLAVKLTDMAVRGSREGCNIFVEKMGLKPLFAFFMRKGMKKKDFAESEEFVLGLIHSIARHATANSQARLMNKFVENQFEKLQRLFEVHTEFSQRVKLADEQRREGREAIADEMELNEEDIYLERCDDGLATLQLADLILVRLANMGNRELTDAVGSLFALKGVSKEEVQAVVTEYCAHLDEDLGAKEKKEVLRYLKEVVGGGAAK